MRVNIDYGSICDIKFGEGCVYHSTCSYIYHTYRSHKFNPSLNCELNALYEYGIPNMPIILLIQIVQTTNKGTHTYFYTVSMFNKQLVSISDQIVLISVLEFNSQSQNVASSVIVAIFILRGFVLSITAKIYYVPQILGIT